MTVKKETTKEQNAAEKKASANERKINEENLSGGEDRVGGMLRDARMKKGFKIADIAKELYIRPAYLEAIESSNYEDIPEPPYGIGFIRSYAEFLGLNSARIVQLFKEEANAKAKADDLYVLEPQSEATVPNKKYLLISMLAIVGLYVAWFSYNESLHVDAEQEENSAVVENTSADNFPLQVEDFATLDETVPAEEGAQMMVIDTTTATPVSDAGQVTVNEGNFVEPEEPEVKAPEMQKTEITEDKTVQAEPEVKVVDPKANARVVLKINKETWVEVKDQDKLWISKVLQPGDVYKVPSGQGKILSVGRNDGVEVLIDGKVVPVVTPEKKIGISLDKYLEDNH